MKKLILITSIAFLLISCDTEPMEMQQTNTGINGFNPIDPNEDLFSGDNPFVGTWESIGAIQNDPNTWQAKLVFSEINIEYIAGSTSVYKDGILYDAKNDYPLAGTIERTGKDLSGYREYPDDVHYYVYTDDYLLIFIRSRSPDWPLFDECRYDIIENVLFIDDHVYKKVSKNKL